MHNVLTSFSHFKTVKTNLDYYGLLFLLMVMENKECSTPFLLSFDWPMTNWPCVALFDILYIIM